MPDHDPDNPTTPKSRSLGSLARGAARRAARAIGKLAQEPNPAADASEADRVTGYCDGYSEGAVHGWAWRPGRPHEHVEVELVVDGAPAGKATANILRGDLRDSGIGDGHYGWRFPLPLDPKRNTPIRVEARIARGGPLPNGILELKFDPSQAGAVGISPPEPFPPPPTPPEIATGNVVGSFDGIRDGALFGWAWQPDRPEQHVQVELWVDDTRVGEAVAKEPRADLLAAGMGHGRYGWRLPLALDPARTTPVRIEVRARGGEALANGVFELAADSDLTSAASSTGEEQPGDMAFGACDGYRDGALNGWAWRPSRPQQYVDVELWVDGILTSETTARIFRADLRANGIGHGRYGWRIPLALDPARSQPLKIEIRARGEGPLANGVFELRDDLPLEDPQNEALRPFVASVLEGARAPSLPIASPPKPVVNILLHCPAPPAPGPLEAREYDDYPGAMNAFRTVLESLGRVSTVSSAEEANQIHEERLRNGESAILLSFAQPHRMPPGLRCPAVPVFAWAFPTIPNRAIGADEQTDWRRALREAGRAIVFSSFARDAVLAEMGPDFPIAVIPVPVSDRVRPQPRAKAPLPGASIGVDGVVFDSRDYKLVAGATALPVPIASPDSLDAAGRTSVKLSGVIFTAVLDFGDGRKNWKDIVRAFRAAHQNNPDATLVLKLSEARAQWWDELSRLLVRNSPFACRVIGIRGEMADNDRQVLIAATHWAVNASNAEGLNLPLMEYMCAGRPVIAPAHTALADYIDSLNALVVASDEEGWVWPQLATEGEGWSWTLPPEAVTPTTRHRLSWSGLTAAFREAYRLAIADSERYSAMSAAARESVSRFCGDQKVAAQLDAFLGLGQERCEAPENPSWLVAEFGRE
jgi:glycosyltransferase involved in cell wall biosynthesis